MHRAFVSAAAISFWCWISPASAQEPSSIGYPSVKAALEALRTGPMAIESSQDGWTLFSRAGDLELWSFTPANHPAHPSAAKRTAYQDGKGAWHVVTRLLCGSMKAACDKLMKEYEQLDEQLKVHIQRKHRSGTQISIILTTSLLSSRHLLPGHIALAVRLTSAG